METKRRIPFILVLLCLSWDQIYPQEYGDGDDLTDECGSNPLDLVLLVDTSDANDANYDREVRNFLSEFVEYADVNSGAVRVALVTFSTGVQIEWRLGEIDNIAGIQNAIRNVPFTPGDRNTADALEMLRRGIFFEPYGDRPDAPNALIIITSGNSNRNTPRTVPQAEALHQGDVSILVIGIDIQNEEETNGMASSPSEENTFYLQSIDELSHIQDLVFVQLCAPLMNEKIPDIYTAGDALDLIFLFHFSDDMSEDNFRYILSYVSGLLIGADVDNGNVRVGAALYRHDGVPLFQLNQYKRKEDIINALENIPYNYRSARASLAAGIETVRTSMFQHQAGDRDEAPNGLILITDSTSTIKAEDVADEAQKLRDSKVTVFSIGLGLRSTDEMRTVATSNDNNFLLRTVQQLPALTSHLQDRIPALKAALPQPTEAPIPVTEPEPEPTTAAPEIVTILDPTTIENSDIADVLVVFHSSHKTKARDFNKNLKTFLSDIFAKAKIEPNKVRVAVVNYGSRVNSLFNFNTHTTKPKARGAIRKLKAKLRSSKSNLGATLRHIRRTEFSRGSGSRISEGVPGAIILVTDMPSDRGAIAVEDEAELLKRSGISILTVGIGKADRAELSAISSKPEYAQYVPNYASLKSNANILGNIKNTIYALQGPKSRKPPPTPIVVTTAQPEPETTLAPERVTTMAPVLPLADSDEADIVVAVHSSRSTSARDFSRLKDYLKSLFARADIDNGKVQTSCIVYGRHAQTIFYLNQYNTAQQVSDAIDRISPRLRSDIVDSSAALVRAREMFGSGYGARATVPKALFMITDSASTVKTTSVEDQKTLLQNEGVDIFSIGVGIRDKSELELLSTSPNNIYNVQGHGQLAGNAEEIRNRVYALNTAPAPPIPTVVPQTPGPIERITPPRESGTVGPPIKITFPSPTVVTTPIPITILPPAGECDFAKVDLVIIIDSSTSVGKKNFKLTLNFVKDLLRGYDIDSGNVRVGIVTYSTGVVVRFQLNTYSTKSEVFDAIDNIPYVYGSTNTAGGLDKMRNEMFTPRNGDREDVRNLAIIITDGVSNINARRTIPNAEEARKEGIFIYSIGIGLTDTRELDGMASPPASENSFNVQGFDELEGVGERIFRSLCPVAPRRTTARATEPPTPKPTPEPTPKPTTKRPRPRTPKPDIVTTPIPITILPTAGACDFARVDLVIIIDSSTSVGKKNFKLTLKFVKDLLRGYDIDSGNVRVGIVTYNTGVVVRFQLNTYSTKSEVFDAIDNIPYVYGSTNTAGGLDKMRNEMFTPRNGDREDVRNLAIIITDGVSNINARRTIPNAEDARKDGIFIYSIGIGLTDTRELDGIASPPASENSFNVQGFDELEGVGERIFQSLCQVGPVVTTPRPTEPPTPEPITTAKPVTEKPRPRTPKPRTTPEPERGTQPPTPEPSAYDLVIILDSSVNQRTYQWMLDFSKRLTRQLNIDGGEYRVGVLRYSTNSDVQFNLNDHLNQRSIRPAIDRIQHRPGQTNTAKAFETVRTQMFRPQRGDRDFARNYILLLTGNEKSLDTNEIWREAERAENEDIGIFVVGINTDDTSEIDETSTHPLSQYQYLVHSRSDLLKIPERLDTVIRGMPDIPPRDWPRLRPRLTTTTMAPTTPTPKPTGYDLVIVLDSSVTPEIYQWMLNFVKRLTKQLNVDGGEFRVGVMRYSTYANIQFNLDDHLTQSGLSPAIQRIQYQPGETNTAKALESVRTRMFRRSEGDRDYARNFILLLTGNEESLSTNDAWAAAERAEDDGIGIYVIGIDIDNTNEIDEVASHPLSEYRFLVRRESDLMEIPGQLDFKLHKMPERPPRQWPRRRPRLTTPAPTYPTLKPGEKCSSVGDIVFILDSSGSVGRDNFYNVLNFTYNTVDELDIDTGHYRIGVITFSDNARTEFRLDRYDNKRDIERALTQVRYVYGSTHTAAALRLARTEFFQPNGDRPNVPNVIVIVTDGESNINHLETIPEARMLKRDGVSIITVAIGFTDRSSELIGLTSPPITENLIRVESFGALDRLKDKLVAPLCTDTDMCSPNPCQNGGRCVDGLRSYICQCTEGFHGENCDKRCGEPADVVFVLDSSNTVGRETFRRMKSYAEQLVTEMDVEVCNIRVGVMKYSSRSMVQFHLGAYRDTDTINRVIDSVSYTRGRANMAGAFNTLRRRMFHGNGDRSNVRNIAYVLTDGSADINADNTMQEAELAIQSGIYIVPVGVSLRERGEVESIALSQGANTIEIDSEDTFLTMRDEVLRPIFDLTDHCATNPCKHGGTCRNGGNGYSCSCVPGFTGDRCQKRCNAQGDIVFAVDTSRYATRKELRRVKRFLRSLVKRMSFKRQGFRVGIVEYNSKARVTLTFQNGRKKKAALAAVSGIRSRGGNPDPTEALRKANVRIFDKDERRNVPNYLIFVTKSMNNENNVIRQANKLKIAGTRIIGVGIGLTSSEKEFLSSAVSSPVPSYMYNVPNVQGLNDVADSIMVMLCDERNMCESDPCGNRGECVSTPGSYYCQCRPGYAGKTCQKACNAKADVAFLLDSSGSVGQKNFQKMKNFLIHMVDDMTIGYDATRVGVASFSDTARLAFNMDEYLTKDDVRRAISGVDYEYGNTNTASGIKLVRNHILDPKRGDRKDAQNFLIIMTDGLSNINAENTLKEAELAKKEGTHVISIGIGSFDPFEINAMATEPASKNAYIIDSFDRLFNVSDRLVSATCRDPSICDENPCRNGGVCKPLINGYTCKCRNGYRGRNCESACQSKKDIVFVLDSSSSVGEGNFQQMLNFVKALVEELSAPGTNNRFGLVTYSTEPNLIFSLGRYPDPGTVSTAVATTRYTPGSTNTAGGLRTAMEIFTNNYGNRRDADDVVILITDGESNVQAYNTIPTADELKRNSIKILSIGIGISNSDEITRIASSTDDVFQVGGFDSLTEVKTDILDTSCRENEE